METDRFTLPRPYRVLYGWREYQDFGRWEDALAFYAKTPGASEPMNLERSCDGTGGLTEDEREAVERT